MHCMFFVILDENNLVRAIVDGGKDYVHRITGNPHPDAVQIPDNAICISDADKTFLEGLMYPWMAKWDGTKLIRNPTEPRDEVEANIVTAEMLNIHNNRQSELDAMTDQEIADLATSLGL